MLLSDRLMNIITAPLVTIFLVAMIAVGTKILTNSKKV